MSEEQRDKRPTENGVTENTPIPDALAGAQPGKPRPVLAGRFFARRRSRLVSEGMAKTDAMAFETPTEDEADVERAPIHQQPKDAVGNDSGTLAATRIASEPPVDSAELEAAAVAAKVWLESRVANLEMNDQADAGPLPLDFHSVRMERHMKAGTRRNSSSAAPTQVSSGHKSRRAAAHGNSNPGSKDVSAGAEALNRHNRPAETDVEADGPLKRIARSRQLRIAPPAQFLKAAGVAGAASGTDLKVSKDAVAQEVLFVERRLADRRGGEAAERVREQQLALSETVLSMRKGGTALIALNAAFLLVVLGVLLLWRAHPSQAAELSELQNATTLQMAEMRKTLQASELAAYAACLGSQSARSMLLQMKAGSAAAPQMALPTGAALETVAASAEMSGAQIKFDLDDAATMNAHLPVLFHLGVQNVGSSMALNAKVWGSVKVLDVAKDPDFHYDEVALTKKAISPNEPPAKVVLYTTEAGLVVPLKEEEYQRVTAGEAYVVAYGRVVYEDLWGVKRWAEFCHYITQPAGVESHSNGCLSYNGTGLIRGTDRLREREKRPLNAEMMMPENLAIACVEPKN